MSAAPILTGYLLACSTVGGGVHFLRSTERPHDAWFYRSRSVAQREADSMNAATDGGYHVEEVRLYPLSCQFSYAGGHIQSLARITFVPTGRCIAGVRICDVAVDFSTPD